MKTNQGTLGNRLKLLDAAAEVFSRTGYNGASLRTIAKRADVSFQLIQHHFGTKHDLWIAVVEYLYAEFVLPKEMLTFDARSDLKVQFREHLRRMIVTSLEHSTLRKILIMEQFEDSLRYHKHLKPKMQKFFSEHMRPYFEEVVELGILPGWTAAEAALVWSSVVTKQITEPDFVEFFIGDATGSKKSVNQMVTLMWHLLCGQPRDRRDATAAQEDRSIEVAPSSDAPDVQSNVIYPSDFRPDTEEDSFLTAENKRLKQLVGELTLENRLLTEQIKDVSRPRKRGRNESGSGDS